MSADVNVKELGQPIFVTLSTGLRAGFMVLVPEDRETFTLDELREIADAMGALADEWKDRIDVAAAAGAELAARGYDA